MDRDPLVRAVDRGAVLWASYHDFVFRDRDYQTDLLPRLAFRVKFNELRVFNLFIFAYFDMIKVLTAIIFFWQEAIAARVSFILDLRIQYVGDSGPPEEMIDVARRQSNMLFGYTNPCELSKC